MNVGQSCAAGCLGALGVIGLLANSVGASTLENPTTERVGVSTSAVGACLEGAAQVAVTWNGSVDFVAGPNPYYTIDQLRIADYGNLCRGRNFKIALSNSVGSLTHQTTGVVPNSSNFNVALPDINATALHHVSVVMH